MNTNISSKKKFIHLYNPKKEGLGPYDVHYINAYKKEKSSKNYLSINNQTRYAAWSHSLEVFQN